MFYQLWPHALAQALQHEHVETWEDLSHLSFSRLLCYKGVSHTALSLIRAQLSEHGYLHNPVETPWAAPAPMQPVLPLCGVYFAQCGPFIKIGFAKNVTHRLKDIATAVPFEVVLVYHVACELIDARELEAVFHRQFQAEHHRGEWFRYEGALERFILEETAARE